MLLRGRGHAGIDVEEGARRADLVVLPVRDRGESERREKGRVSGERRGE